MAVVFPLVTLSIPLLFLVLFRPPRINRIGPNAWVGIRTAETMKSHKAWAVAHTRAWPYIVASSAVLGAILIVTIVWSLTVDGDKRSTVAGLGTTLGTIVWLIVLLMGAKVAHQEVKALSNS